MTNVLLTTDTVGGVWNYCMQLARALLPWNTGIALATMGGPLSEDQREEVSRQANVQLFESRYRLMWMQDPWRDVAAAGDWLLRVAEQTRPDLVHLNDYAHGGLPWKAPVLMVGHSCVLSWWESVRGTEVPASCNRYRRLVAQGLHAADLVVAPTQTMLDTLQRLYGPLARAQVIFNGCDRQAFWAASKQPIVLSAGRVWDEAKNIATLARAARRLAWPVLVAGDSRHPDGGEARFAGVRFLGRLSAGALARRYAQAAIYALPARYEPFGLTPLEAALSGCTLVLGDIPTLREIWEDAAWFVPSDDVDALAYAVNHLIGDPQQRFEYSARARARALRLSARRMATAYWEAYQGLLGRPSAVTQSSGISDHVLSTSLSARPPAP